MLILSVMSCKKCEQCDFKPIGVKEDGDYVIECEGCKHRYVVSPPNPYLIFSDNSEPDIDWESDWVLE